MKNSLYGCFLLLRDQEIPREKAINLWAQTKWGTITENNAIDLKLLSFMKNCLHGPLIEVLWNRSQININKMVFCVKM